MKTGTGIVELALVLGMASSGCAAAGLSMRVSGQLRATAPVRASCEIGPGDVPTAVRWTLAQRQALESAAHDGLVVIATDGCHVRVLVGCHARDAYTYTGVPLQSDRRELSSGAGLGASLEVLGSRLGGDTRGRSHYELDVAIIGSFRAERPIVRADDLEGACAGANGFVASYDAGAFVLSQSDGHSVQASMGSLSAAGLHGYSGADESQVTRSGEIAACLTLHSDVMPVPGCSAAVDVHLAPLAPALPQRPATGLPPAAAPAPGSISPSGVAAAAYGQVARYLREFVPPAMLSSL